MAISKQMEIEQGNWKAQNIAKLETQVEALRTMAEGAEIFATGRRMIEKRRARFIAEGEACLAAAQAKPARWFSENMDLLFSDDLI